MNIDDMTDDCAGEITDIALKLEKAIKGMGYHEREPFRKLILELVKVSEKLLMNKVSD